MVELAGDSTPFSRDRLVAALSRQLAPPSNLRRNRNEEGGASWMS